MSHLPVEGHCLSAKDALSRGGLDAARVLAHREDVQHRLLVEIAAVFGPASEVVVGCEAISTIAAQGLALGLAHAHDCVHRTIRAVLHPATAALSAGERPEVSRRPTADRRDHLV